LVDERAFMVMNSLLPTLVTYSPPRGHVPQGHRTERYVIDCAGHHEVDVPILLGRSVHVRYPRMVYFIIMNVKIVIS
jgi:hypothetical protein